MKWIQTQTYKHYRLPLLCFTHYLSVHTPLTNKKSCPWKKKRLAFGNRRALCVFTKTQGLTSFFLPPLQESLMNRALQSYCPATSSLYCCKQEAEYTPSYRAFSGTSVLSHCFGDEEKGRRRTMKAMMERCLQDTQQG